MGNAYKNLDREPEWKRLLGIPMYRWKDTINIDFRYIIWDGLDWVCLAEDMDP
jgi:hypothetical protein